MSLAEDRARQARLRVAIALTWVVVALATIAAAIGLWMPAVYRETAWVVPQNRGQDLITLLALAVLVPVLRLAQQGSPRGTLIWLGLVGYLAYTYTGAAFAYAFNELFLVYVALFGATGATLIAALSGIDARALQGRFDEATPRRAVAGYLVAMVAVLCLLWLSQIVPFLTRGELPNMIVQAKTPTVFVYVLDLGVVVPLSLLGAWWLWQRRPWGEVLAGFVLVKAATMGLALLAMTAFSMQAGQPVDAGLAAVWVTLATSALVMSVWFYRHCR
jgi:hypothetical protein